MMMKTIVTENIVRKNTRHKSEGVFIAKLLRLEQAETILGTTLLLWLATVEGLIVKPFPCDGRSIDNESELGYFLCNLLNENLPDELVLEDLIGRKCHVYIYRHLPNIEDGFCEIMFNHHLYDPQRERGDIDELFEVTAEDYNFDSFFQPCEDDFLNYEEKFIVF